MGLIVCKIHQNSPMMALSVNEGVSSFWSICFPSNFPPGTPINHAFTNKVLIDEFWNILQNMEPVANG